MARKCSICSHKDRKKIDAALIEKVDSIERISTLYGVTESSLKRHVANGHLSKRVAKAVEAKEIAQADSLLDQVRSLSNRALTILSQAEGTGDLRTACSAIREVRSTLELLMKVSGELKGDQTQVNVAVIIDPEKILGAESYKEYERRIYAEIAD